MSAFVEGIDRSQSTFFPAMLDDYVSEDNLVRAVDAFVEGLDLGKLGFSRVVPLERGRPSYHPATLLKIYIYGYLNRVPSSRRLERECQRNIELIWLTGQLAPDFKTVADFRKDNGKAIREVCRAFVALCLLVSVGPTVRLSKPGMPRTRASSTTRWTSSPSISARGRSRQRSASPLGISSRPPCLLTAGSTRTSSAIPVAAVRRLERRFLLTSVLVRTGPKRLLQIHEHQTPEIGEISEISGLSIFFHKNAAAITGLSPRSLSACHRHCQMAAVVRLLRSGRKWKTTDFTDFADRRSCHSHGRSVAQVFDLRRSAKSGILRNLICHKRKE